MCALDLVEELSLADSAECAQLHPFDQFRATQAMRDQGLSEEEVEATFSVAPSDIWWRLKLAAASPVQADAYAHGVLSLDQMIVLSVNPGLA